MAPRPEKEWTRAHLADRISRGETLVLKGRTIYKLDSWLKRHPGGELALLHFVGRDASDEIDAYHSAETLKRMSAFAVATLSEEDWKGPSDSAGRSLGYRPLIPPIQLGYRDGVLDSYPAHAVVGHSAYHTAERLESKEPIREDLRSAPKNHDLLRSKPHALPIPVAMLEPPAETPGIDVFREQEISTAFKQLHSDVKEAGLYDLRPGAYTFECVRYILLGTLSLITWWTAQGRTSYLMLSALCLGLFWHQLTFTAHDAGHSGITHHHSIDRLIGIAIANFAGGLSLGWWCDNHDVHHLVTNHPEHDPDIQHMPFFAISPGFFGSKKPSSMGCEKTLNADSMQPTELWSTYYRRTMRFDAFARIFLSIQHKVYYLVMSLGRFNLYANSYGFLALKAKRDRWLSLECSGILFFWLWYSLLLKGCPTWGLRAAYVIISHVATSPLHVQIVLSHFAQSSDDKGLSECFASRQLRTTMDVQCPTYLDFIHGGLHMQVTHHLFPRLPRHNLRECRDRFVRPFAAQHKLPYEEYTFVQGNRKVLSVLQDVANQANILAKVMAAQARGELAH